MSTKEIEKENSDTSASESESVPAKEMSDTEWDRTVKERQRKAAEKRQKARERNERKKAEIARLRAQQIRGCELILFNVNGVIRRLEIDTEEKYIQTLENLVGTLKDNELLNDYDIAPLRPHKPLDSSFADGMRTSILSGKR